jgi:hypothetical protein
MGSTTTSLALPYPVGTDRVMDGDNAMQALAERLDAVIAGTTGIISPGAGLTILSDNRVWRRATMCGFPIKWSVTAPFAAAASVGSVPAGFRPPVDWSIVCYQGPSQVATLTVRANGNIHTEAALASGLGLYGHAVYPMAAPLTQLIAELGDDVAAPLPADGTDG